MITPYYLTEIQKERARQDERRAKPPSAYVVFDYWGGIRGNVKGFQ